MAILTRRCFLQGQRVAGAHEASARDRGEDGDILQEIDAVKYTSVPM